MQWKAYYQAFGDALVVTNEVTNNLRFSGQYFDAETELYQNYFRDYDPKLGRYIESDPIWIRKYRLFNGAYCTVCSRCTTPNCLIKKMDRKYMYNCKITNSVRDPFEDVLNIPVEIPGGTPYDVVGQWHDEISGGGTI